MYKIVVYVPEKYCSQVKAALFAAGAGRIGNYDQCSWQVLGEGQFRPLAGSQPFIGQQNQVECVREYRLEMLCCDAQLAEAISAMKKAHPYEEVAYDVWPLTII